MTEKIYIFSGLGADERVFQKLDFSGIDVTFITWIIPLEKESIEQYATRLLNQIPSKNPIVIGLSFGGIMAVEIAKQIETKKIILIASAKTKDEIPFYFRLVGKLNLHKILPASLLKSSNLVTNWFFGTCTLEDKQLLKQILIDTNPFFLKWALDKVAKWKNVDQPKNIFHITETVTGFCRCNLSKQM
ncbi:MAG: alpha/beta hydrolase [Flavobacterium sp.]